jgi:hypothetical protein
VNSAVNAAWSYLVVAGLFEIGWPLGLKWAQEAQRTPALVFGVVVAVVAMGISGFLLYLAQREIALGTSYAVWTGGGDIPDRRVVLRRPERARALARRRPHRRGRRHAQARALMG